MNVASIAVFKTVNINNYLPHCYVRDNDGSRIEMVLISKCNRAWCSFTCVLKDGVCYEE